MWIFDLFKTKSKIQIEIDSIKKELTSANVALKKNYQLMRESKQSVQCSEADIRTLIDRITISSPVNAKEFTERVIIEEKELARKNAIFIGLKNSYEKTEAKIREETNKLNLLESGVSAKQIQLENAQFRIKEHEIDLTELDQSVTVNEAVADFQEQLGKSATHQDEVEQRLKEILAKA